MREKIKDKVEQHKQTVDLFDMKMQAAYDAYIEGYMMERFAPPTIVAVLMDVIVAFVGGFALWHYSLSPLADGAYPSIVGLIIGFMGASIALGSLFNLYERWIA